MPHARSAGIMYLAIIGLGLFGELFARGSLVVAGNPEATAANIAHATTLWRAALAGDLLMHVLDVPLIVFFYLLLGPVSASLALTATVFNIVQTCVLVANKSTLVMPLLLLADTSPAAVSGQSAMWVGFAISMHGHGFGIGLIFFGLSCLIRGLLIVRSALLPRALGGLVALAGLAYLVNSAALLMLPALAKALFPWILLPAFVGELALALWLVVKGVDREAWARLHPQRTQGAT